MAKNIGICQLFQKEAKLVKAHIIPEWVFRDARGGDAFLIYINSEEPHPKRSPIGPYDSNILSREAEDHLAKFDNYASQFFRKPPPNDINKQMKDNYEFGYYHIQDFNYERLKLFVISVIWRASVSKMDEYKSINLGPKYEELARQAILNCDCQGELLFPTMIWRYFPSIEIESLEKTVFDPLERQKIGNGKVNFYLLKILDWWLWMKVDNRPMPDYCKRNQIKKEPPLIIPMIPFEKRPDYGRMKTTINSHPAFQ